MSFPQRPTPRADPLAARAPWTPGHLVEVPRRPTGPAASLPAAAAPAAGVPDWYVVVDELDELGCRLTVDPWPAVDGDGRLVFGPGTLLVTVPPRVLHAALLGARRRQDEPAPDRHLRIGDVLGLWWGPFAHDVLGLGAPGGEVTVVADPTVEVEMVDLTADARVAAKLAALAAAGGVLDPDDPAAS